MGPDTGVFIDASHLLTVARRFRQPEQLMGRIEAVAGQLGLGTGISHRVVIANCVHSGERSLAEALALKHGFRIRHVPAGDTFPVGAVLASEVYDAARSPGLRIVVLVSSPLGLTSHVDTLHRDGRLVIMVTADADQPVVSDSVVSLPLDPSALGAVAEAGVHRLAQATGFTSEAALNEYLSRHVPAFRPGAYGFRSMRELVGELRRLGFNLTGSADGLIRPTGPPKSREPLQSIVPVGRSSYDVTKAAELTPLARQLCGAIAKPREGLEAQVEAMREVVAVLLADATIASTASGEGIPAKVLSAAFRTAATGWVKRQYTVTKLFQAAMAGSEWRAVRSLSNDTIVRFVLGDAVPDGFEPVVMDAALLTSQNPDMQPPESGPGMPQS